jgi:lipopolysaccharide transport system ATP-binding protein
MSDIVIKVEDLGKKYIIDHQSKNGHQTFRDVIADNIKGLLRPKSTRQHSKNVKEEFWALNNVNFEIKAGDRVGIIGRNGAGKSTLLKILSRITEPTNGKITIRGRVASLLEVGTGFHPELTGRENIFLNGAILGMNRIEIKRKFDEIVAFAEVERFLDTPVKRYSSGMYVRLAFAVAAHLEPEILVVDEVLAVGDAQFQKKCLGKMAEVSEGEGRTVLFVSHNMAAVKNLCTKGLMLEQGTVKYSGEILEAVNLYQKGGSGYPLFEHKGNVFEAPGNDNIRILKFLVSAIEGEIISVSSGVRLAITFFNNKPNINLDVTFEIKNMEELIILHQGKLVSENKDAKKGIYKVVGEIPANLLNAGTYVINLIFGEDQRYVLYNLKDFIQFEIMNENLGSNSNILPGVIRPVINYSQSFEGSMQTV